MSTHPCPSDFERLTNSTYDALMWALARPGLVQNLPASGLAPVVETLLDRECAVYCDDAALADAVARSGAGLVAPEEADHLFLSREPSEGLLSSLRLGSDMYPEDGATVVIATTLNPGIRLTLTGPGVDKTLEISLSAVRRAFWEERKRLMRYPMGFEVFFVDGHRVIGVPRSTTVKVL